MTLNLLQQEEYKIDLAVFEGPLDLLLYLIRRDEIDIYDIPIERVTSQYMQYLDMMRMLDLNIAGDFLVMAATLMVIKSRMLLPVEQRGTEDAPGDDAWIDPRLDLIRQLIEYKKFKDAAGQLREREILRGEAFAFGGEAPGFEQTPDQAQPLGDIGLFDLLTAFQEVLARAPQETLPYFEPIRWSVADKMEAILSLTRQQEVAFSRLFHAGSPRPEIIVTFLALLELLRLRQVAMRQHGAFKEIVVLAVPENAPDSLLPAPVIGGSGHVES